MNVRCKTGFVKSLISLLPRFASSKDTRSAASVKELDLMLKPTKSPINFEVIAQEGQARAGDPAGAEGFAG